MREIEFRAWNNEKKEMWYQDNPYHSSIIVSTVGKEFCNLEDVDIELMQYTGLKDINGTKIFEGDIVLYKDWETTYWEGGGNDSFINKGIIEYLDENCCFNVTERQTVELEEVLYEGNETLEVIGNKWDNPELLEEE